MNAPAAPSRPLQVLAVVLGVAIAALLVAWTRRAPPLPPAEPPTTAAPTEAATATPATARRDADSPREPAPASARSEESASPTSTSAVLFGAIRRADGTPVEDGFLWVDQRSDTVGRPRRGAYAFAGVQPGVHRLTSRIPDELPIDREVHVQAPRTRVDIDLPPKWLLTVTAVTPEGKALREAVPEFSGLETRNLRALAFAQPLAGDLVSSRSAEFEAGLGTFRVNDPIFDRAKPMPKEVLGVLTLPHDQPVHVALLFGGTLIAQQAATPGQAKLEFVVAADALGSKTCTATFRCVDANGAPVAGARVSVSSGSGLSSGPKMLTDAEGRYTATKLLPGRVGFGVWHERLRAPPVETVLAPGSTVDLGDLTLLPGVDLEISFAGSGGEGSAYAYWLDVPRESRWRTTYQPFSEQNGVVAKASLHPGRYALLVRGKNGAALLEIDTTALPPQPLRIPWGPAATLRIDSRTVATYVQFEIATPRGVLAFSGETGNRGYTIKLPPGDYVATIRGDGGSTTQKNVALPASGAVLTLP